MDTLRLQQVSRIFEAARVEPEGGREAFVHGACSDPAVREEVLSLLRHHDDDSGPLEAPLLGEADAAAALMELDERRRRAGKPKTIGPYRVIRLLGEGGMGVVYLAEQERPRRTVALKVVRSGLASRRMLRRFEFEAAVLGMLNHPGIAHIYEAGLHDDGESLRPFFAMEYVEGTPLTTLARERNLGTHQRLELLATVCDAVQHAHQRGVIHRDLKPGNILIDAEGQPKVLDFGVARATDSDVQATTLYTDVGQLVGTLPYMSPEQVSGDATRLDTRSDVYALGVIMYELLALRLPHDVRGKSIAEAARVIGEGEPTPLSSIDRVFRGDLQTIVARALEKDKERRYPSAADLAADIRRFLNDEPIEAKRDSMTYMLRKRLRRYRMAVAAVVVGALGLGAFAGYAAFQARAQMRLVESERYARTQAELAGESAAAAERLAEEQRDDARRARDSEAGRSLQAQAVTAFLVNTLGMTNPDVSQSAAMTKESMLANASVEVDAAFPGQPEAEASVRAVIGKAYAAIGQPEPAAHHLWQSLRLRRALPVRDPAVEYDILWPYVQVLDDLQDPSFQRQRTDANQLAMDLVAQRLPAMRPVLSELNAGLIGRTNAEGMTQRYRELIATANAQLAPDDAAWTPLADLLHAFSIRLRRRDLSDVGLDALVTALDIHRRTLGETNTRVVRVSSDLLDEMLHDRRIADATRFAEQTVQSLLRVLPEDHWYVAVMRFRLGVCLAAADRHAEAQGLMTAALPRIIDDRGIGSDQAVLRLSELVRFLDDTAQHDEASTYRARYSQARAASIRATVISTAPLMLGPGFDKELSAVRNLMDAVGQREPDVEARFDAMMTAWRARVGDGDARSAFICDFFTAMSERVMKTRGAAGGPVAQRMLLEAVHIDEVARLRHPRRQGLTRYWLARVAESQNDFVEGERWAREAIAILDTGPVERFGLLANAHSVLGGCLAGQQRFEEAEPLLLAGYMGMRDDAGTADDNTSLGLERLIGLYERTQRDEQAAQWRKAAIEAQLSAAPRSADHLNRAAWHVVKMAAQRPDVYAAALEAASQAVQLAPQRAAYVNTLGAAQFRAGRLEEALQTLRRSRELSASAQFEDAAFLALVHAARGDHDAATAERALLLAAEPSIPPGNKAEFADLQAQLDQAIARALAATPQ